MSVKTIQIFLASSEELAHERKVVAALVNRLNYLWEEYDVFVQLVKWEYLDSSMSAQHKQEDYNEQLRQCDACIVLFWTKCGPYTRIELDTAAQMFADSNTNARMGVLFKSCEYVTPELREFSENYRTMRPRCCYTFDDDSSLKELICLILLDSISDKQIDEQKTLEKKLLKTKRLLAIAAMANSTNNIFFIHSTCLRVKHFVPLRLYRNKSNHESIIHGYFFYYNHT